LLVLPLDMIDTSGEMPPRAKVHEDRLEALASYLSKALVDERIYSIIDPTTMGATIAEARSVKSLAKCNGCERDLARLVGADRVLVGEVDKVSTLIGSLTLRIADVETGRNIFVGAVSFRDDTYEAWQRAMRSLIRELEKPAAQAR
jgi:hypothetical protein